jgi:hypothetical protein
MKNLLRALALLPLCSATTQATELIWNTGWSNYSYSQSQSCGSPVLLNEAADDFEVVGLVERVYVTGYNSCIASCFPPPLSGARVRFYEWTANGPGALQSEQFVAAPNPALLYDPNDISDIDVTLPQPFVASGKHYVSVQLEFASCFFWAYWVANKDNPLLGAAYQRANNGAWTKTTAFNMQSSDLSYSLYGTVGVPPPPLGCGTWNIEPSPNAHGMKDTWLEDVAYLAPDDIWAVGRTYGLGTPGDWNQYTYAIHYDGSSWSPVPTPSPNPVQELTYCSLNAVAALAPNDVWAAGTRLAQDTGAGYVGTHNLVLHWNGSSWQQMNAPIPPSFGLQGVSGDGIYEILALAADDVWFFGEWITMNEQGYTFRYALAMHWDGSGFTLHDVPIVGSGGATILAADAASPDDIWAAGMSGDGDPAPSSLSFIYHWDGSHWSHVPSMTLPGYWHTLAGVKVLAPDDVWISGSAWAPPNEVTQFMLHWDGSGYEYVPVPYAGGAIVGAPPTMYVFGGGGISLYDGTTFSDAHLFEGFEALTGYGLGAAKLTGACEMIAVGSQNVAGNARTLVARLQPLAWPQLGQPIAGSNGMPHMTGSGSLAPGSSNLLGLSNAQQGSIAVLVYGASAVDLALFGGTLVPLPEVLKPLTTDAAGGAALPFTWPSGIPAGATLYAQFWMLDPAAAQGFAASNGVRGISK